MKICTIVGARPQFIKAASLSRVLRQKHNEILIHTGQHYDDNMSEIFFTELDIPRPDYNLNIGSMSHARQTAAMMIGIEDVLLSEKPDAVILYGDTNSTLAGAIVAGKLNIPIAHVEAGVRSFVRDMPEEQNRMLTDHLAKWNFAPSALAVEHLKKEGITESVHNVGDIMYDGLLYYSKKAEKNERDSFYKRIDYLMENKSTINIEYYLATIHRPENTDDINILTSILNGLNALNFPVLFPIHPRIKKAVMKIATDTQFNNIHFVKPLGYIDIIYFAKNAIKIITDSGGLHKEAFWLKIPSVVILRNTAWEETLNGNCNVLASPDKIDIIDKVNNTVINYNCYNNTYYGDGTTAKQITELLI